VELFHFLRLFCNFCIFAYSIAKYFGSYFQYLVTRREKYFPFCLQFLYSFIGEFCLIILKRKMCLFDSKYRKIFFKQKFSFLKVLGDTFFLGYSNAKILQFEITAVANLTSSYTWLGKDQNFKHLSHPECYQIKGKLLFLIGVISSFIRFLFTRTQHPRAPCKSLIIPLVVMP
jgi:hypothetical protein